MKVGPKSSLRPFLHQALQILVLWCLHVLCLHNPNPTTTGKIMFRVLVL